MPENARLILKRASNTSWTIGEGVKNVPVFWAKIAWLASFAIAAVSALWMRSLNYGWPAVLGVALVIWIVLPLFISQLCASLILGRIHSSHGRVDELADKIAVAVKGLPPEEQEAVAKRMVDDAFKGSEKR